MNALSEHGRGGLLATGLTALALLSCPAAAQSADRVDQFLAVVESHGCIINKANNLTILAELEMSEAEGSAIVMSLMGDGRAVPHGDDLRITTGTCK